MARVGKYYGVRPGDAIKFMWMDATFAVERRVDKLHRDRVQRAAAEKKATEEAKASVNNEAAETTATENATQEAPATKEKKKGLFSKLGKKDKKAKKADEKASEAESAEVVAASKEASVEEAGAEKMDNPIVGDIDSAAQQGMQQPVQGFDIGGAKFDFNMGPVERVEPSILQNSAAAQQNIFQQPPMQGAVPPQVQQPAIPQQQVPFVTVMGPNGPVAVPQQQVPMGQQFTQQPNYTQPQQPPLHRVDAPPKVIQPKPPRAEADQVEVTNMNVAQGFVDPAKKNKVVKDQHPDLIQKETPHIADVPSEQMYDNSQIIASVPFMGEIQAIALKHHIQLKMEVLGYSMNPSIPTGMILCYAFNDGVNTFNEYKSFTIDPGEIIDRRPKLFKGIMNRGFEDAQAYPVMLTDKTNKSKNVFNAELFEKIFTGGIGMLDDKGMYSPQYRALNKFVDLSTMPTKLMNGERRKAVQDRLMKAMQAGVFEKALKEYAPNSRFEFKENSYNKERGFFVLTNFNVPICFNGPVMSTTPIEITFGPQVFIHSPSNPPAEQAAPAPVKEETTSKADSPKKETKPKSSGKKSTKKQEDSKAEAEASAEVEATTSPAADSSEK